MRLDSPFVLAFAGTIAIHTLAVVAAVIVAVIHLGFGSGVLAGAVALALRSVHIAWKR